MLPSTPAAPAAGAGAGEPPRRSFGALRHGAFRVLWIGLLVSNAGTWAQSVAQGWLVYQLTNSPLMLGILGLSFALPMATLPPVGGVIADRFERLSVLKLTQALELALATMLAWLTFTGQVTIGHIVGLSFLSAVALAFDNPTRQALIPSLVPREDLLSATALNGVAFTGAGLVGPWVAGQILGPYDGQLLEGVAVVFALNAVSFLA